MSPLGALRFATALSTLSLVLVLGGCATASSSAGPAHDRARSPRPQDSSPAPTRTPTIEPIDLSFGEEEEVVESDWAVGWFIPFEDESRFVYTADEPSDGYHYTEKGTGCEIAMVGLRIGDHPLPDSDREISDQLIATMVVAGAPTDVQLAAVSRQSFDVEVWQEEKAATVAFRAWAGSGDAGETTVIAARGFGDMPVALILRVDCPSGADARALYREIIDANARILVRRPVDG